MKRLMLICGLLLLFGAEILRVYFIMPFPGSQESDTIGLAYWLAANIAWIRILALVLVAIPAVGIFKRSAKIAKILLALALVLYGTVFFFFNYRFEADKMFYQPMHKVFANASTDTTDRSRLVIGVAIHGEARAYPIQIIGYHHQVTDTIGNTPVMITYCTVCRTGRAFSPFLHGKNEKFRLVGMDHFNAMFEDATTRSWWQQATGMAVAGPLKGDALKEVPSEQMTLEAWLRRHPESLVMQPDTVFQKKYSKLADYDNGTIEGGLEHRDSLSWRPKSWIVGVLHGRYAKAYDWNDMVSKKLINDSMANLPVLLLLEPDAGSFHVYDRRVNGQALKFNRDAGTIADDSTHSVWTPDGLCVEGLLKGMRLSPLSAYQEFWHSWSNFHPQTTRYTPAD